MKHTNELTLMGTAIDTNSDGLLSLNDLWKASGCKDKDMPSRWTRLKRTQRVIKALGSRKSADRKTVNEMADNDRSEVIKSSANSGTFVTRVLVYSYAMHVSAEFEIEVINAFDKQAQAKLKLADIHGKSEWQQNRELGKLTHRKETDAIQKFLTYASNQGSRNYPKHGYALITKMINSALRIEDRDTISEEALHLLSTAELIAENALQRGMNEQLPYKAIFSQAKANVRAFAEMAIDKIRGE